MKKLLLTLLVAYLSVPAHAADHSSDDENIFKELAELMPLQKVNDSIDYHITPIAIDSRLLTTYNAHIATEVLTPKRTDPYTKPVDLCNPPSCITSYTFQERADIAQATQQAMVHLLQNPLEQNTGEQALNQQIAAFPIFGHAIRDGYFHPQNLDAIKAWVHADQITELHNLAHILKKFTRNIKKAPNANKQNETENAVKLLEKYSNKYPVFGNAYQNGILIPENIESLQKLVDGQLINITFKQKRPSVRAKPQQNFSAIKRINRTRKLIGSKNKKRSLLGQARTTGMEDITNENDFQS